MATLKAVLVTPGETIQAIEIEDNLRTRQTLVGGYIQGVFGRGALIYVDEEGLLKNLSYNSPATIFAQQYMRVPVELFGTALILGPSDNEGNDTSVLPDVLTYFNLGGN
jgi:hypothetical protein